jgi:hypothetical protein
VCFRVGDYDARTLADGFWHFDTKDLQSLGTGEAIVRVERAEYDFNLKTPMLPAIDEAEGQQRREQIVARSREMFGRPRAEVEDLLRQTGSAVEIPTAPVEQPTPAPPIRPSPTAPEVLEAHAAPVLRPETVEIPTEVSKHGRGGAQHKYLQELIRRWAEANGWRAGVEERILDGLGSVDVALRKGEHSLGCEIGVTTAPEHEVQNIQKCLAAGFERVLVVSSEKKTLNQIKALAASSLDAGQAGTVNFCTPEELFQLLDGIEGETLSREETVRGYKVKVRYKAAKPGEREEKRGAVSAVIAKAMKRMRRQK